MDAKRTKGFLEVMFPPLCLLPRKVVTFSTIIIGSVLQEVYHEKHIQRFWEENRNAFSSFKVVGPEENLSQGEARNMGMYVSCSEPLSPLSTGATPILHLGGLQAAQDNTD